MSNTPFPFPGLRSYRESEKRLFFGRDQEIWQIKGRLRNSRIVILLSPPKMGKTSLLNCGLIPDLKEKGFPGKAGSHWKVLGIRPENDPVSTLAEAMSQPGILHNRGITPDFYDEVLQKLLANVNGLVDLYRSSEFIQSFNLLFVVDPFDAAVTNPGLRPPQLAHFTNLLLRAAKNPQVAVYVVFSICTTTLPLTSSLSEFVDALDQFAFHLHPLNQTELETAIRQPIENSGGKIEDALLKMLIEKLASEPEQLVKLQDSLHKTWWLWVNEHKGQGTILKSHYLQAVGMRGGITAKARVATEEEESERDQAAQPVKLNIKPTPKAFEAPEAPVEEEGQPDAPPPAEEVSPPPAPPLLSQSDLAEKTFAALSAEQRRICRLLFQALTLKAGDPPSESLRPRSLHELEHILDVKPGLIRQVMQQFIQQGSALFTDPVNDNELIRIGYEKITSEWNRLGDWMEEERQNAAKYVNIAKRADRYFLEEDQTALVKGPALQELIDWKNQFQPHQGWAEQYHKTFILGMEFLNICQDMGAQPEPPPPPPPPPPPVEVVYEEEEEEEEETHLPPPPPPPPLPSPSDSDTGERRKIVIRKKE